MTPTDAVGDADTRTLLALLAVYERDGRATVDTVAIEADRGLAVTHVHLHRLHDVGLVDYGVRGALRPLVCVVSA